MDLTLSIKNGSTETIKIDDSVYQMLIEYAKAKNITVEKCLEIICIEYAKEIEKEKF